MAYILQVARSLGERDNSLNSLATLLVIASLVTILAAFGIGWVISEITLRPIQRITQTARAIGDKRDFINMESTVGQGSSLSLYFRRAGSNSG